MAMAAVSCFQEEKRNIGFLERQIEECPAREERFIKRGVEYLCLQNIYDVREIEDGLVDSYMLWLQDKHMIGAYQKTLRDWREFHKEKEYVKLREEIEGCGTVEQTLKSKAYTFLIENGIHSLEEIDWDVRVCYEQYLEKTIKTRICPWYLKGLDKLKLFDLEKRSGGIRAGRIRLKYTQGYTLTGSCGRVDSVQ